ncbi:adenosylcobinamide-GDP ribazoletransferase [Rhizobium sp. SGZ-381]|uniref:adenosylcobinamide-GDP ribazoletransferase n=1 Tax=Rhizobium sp. SGZ-381 TaxID=3342800 RepID=UPI00366A5B22
MPNAKEFWLDFATDLARSLAFLSRLPVPARFFKGHDGTVSRACRAFPLAGALIAVPPALVLLVLGHQTAAPLVVALLTLALMAGLTGGLHEDGVADCADGLGGGRDKEHALAIMKDSRTGSYGVLALILSVGVRAAALSALITAGSASLAALSLVTAAAVSRALMVWHWAALAPARAKGTAVAVGQPQADARLFALVSASLLALVCLGRPFGLFPLLLSLGVAALSAHLFTRFVSNKIGGHTGDTIGATQQITEMALLSTLVIML